jgi:broad specificity phosphatase PhoE
MQIILLRHAEPDLSKWQKIHSSEMSEWINLYNLVGVKKELNFFHQQNALKQNFVVCSNLNRSIHSAKLMGCQSPDLVDAMFREAELPEIKVPIIKLNPNIWAFIFRIFWFAGVSVDIESLSAFKKRVSLAAEKLAQLADKHDSVLFVGHGIMNRFLEKELISKGWLQDNTYNKNKYLGYITLKYSENYPRD